MIRFSFRRAFTLIELLTVVGITAIVSLAAARAYVEGINFDERIRSGRQELLRTRLFEERITRLLEGAYVTIEADDTSTVFIGDMGDGGPAGSGSLSNRLIFTSFGERLPLRFVTSADSFENLNRSFGPQGGVAEVALSTVPVGQPPEVSGLYMRQQRPADGDPTQGGVEEQLDPSVLDIQFEFFDGLVWQPTWDTRTMGTKRIPSAVRVTYQMDNEDSETRIFVVRLPHSDATPTNPVGEAE